LAVDRGGSSIIIIILRDLEVVVEVEVEER
jgi:hypothetical protein